MDTVAVELALGKIGAAFRLSRLYPPTHPAVVEADQQMTAALGALRAQLPVALSVDPHSVHIVGAPPGGRSALLAEMAGLLHARGVRSLVFGPGTTAGHVHALFAVAAGGAALDALELGAIEASRTRRATQQLRAPAAGHATPRPSAGAVFRAERMPLDAATTSAVRAIRLADDPAAQRDALERLAALAPDLVAHAPPTLLAEAITALELARLTASAEVAPAMDRAVSAFTSGDVLAALVARLGDTRLSPPERETVARALGGLGGAATDALLEAYLATPPEAREPIRDAVRVVGERGSGTLERRLGDDRAETVVAAAEFIGLARGPRTGDLLAPLVRHADARVREAALRGLALAGGRAVARVAVPALRDPAAAVRAAAARAVSAAGDETAVDLLVRRAHEEDDDAVTVELLRGIGRLGGAAALSVLAEFAAAGGLLRRRTAVVRSAAVTALGALRSPEARALLEQFTHDREPAVRRAAEAAMQ